MKTQRIKLDVELETNEFFCKEVENSIRGAVKSKTREWFHKEVDELFEIIVDNRIYDWTDNRFNSSFVRALNEKIDAAVRKTLDNFTVTPEMVEARVEKKFEYVTEAIDKAVRARVESLKINEYVTKRVNEVLTQEIVALLIDRLTDQTHENHDARTFGHCFECAYLNIQNSPNNPFCNYRGIHIRRVHIKENEGCEAFLEAGEE